MTVLSFLFFACQPAPGDTAPAADTAEPADSTASWVVGEGPLAAVSGRAFVFGPAPSGLSLAGAVVSVVEDPSYAAVVGEDGAFLLEVPSGAPLTFRVSQEGFSDVDSAALFVSEDGIEQLGFQVPSLSLVEPLAIAAGIDMEPGACQIATTVSSEASPPYGGAGVGEPGAVASITPDPEAEGGIGPVYFAYLTDAVILPDPELTETTIDGGVLWGNVPPGEYTISAQKEGVPFTAPRLRCRAGALVNASPPHGIEFDGG